MFLRLPRVIVRQQRTVELSQLSPEDAIQVIWQITYQIFRACLIALGNDHLLTRAFETALLSKDISLMKRATILLDDGPLAMRQKVLIVLQRL